MLLELRKTKIEFGFSFALTVTLMLLLFEEKIVLMSVLSSVLHECGHFLMMRLSGEKIERVVFGAFGVRIEKIAFSGISYKREIAVALGGIAVNLILAGVSFTVYFLSESLTAAGFAIINLMIALMNSLPLKSLDMGRAMHFFLLNCFSEEKTEKITSTVSFIFFLGFSAFTVFYCAFIKLNFSLIAVSIYLLTETELKIHGQ